MQVSLHQIAVHFVHHCCTQGKSETTVTVAWCISTEICVSFDQSLQEMPCLYQVCYLPITLCTQHTSARGCWGTPGRVNLRTWPRPVSNATRLSVLPRCLRLGREWHPAPRHPRKQTPICHHSRDHSSSSRGIVVSIPRDTWLYPGSWWWQTIEQLGRKHKGRPVERIEQKPSNIREN